MQEVEEYFHIGGDYKWYCPHCKVGMLKVDKEKFQKCETNKSKQSKEDIYGEKDVTEYLFSGILSCNYCFDIVAFIGVGDLANYEAEEINNNPTSYESRVEYIPITVDRFFPKYFYPPVNLFQINENCPDEITCKIVKSFELFWCDLNASANKSRIVVENIIHDIDNEVKGNSLNSKIKNSVALPEKVKEYLLAIKWIGNSGSHNDSELSRNDMIDAYKLLEKSIEILYENENELNDISKEINNKKEPRSK